MKSNNILDKYFDNSNSLDNNINTSTSIKFKRKKIMNSNSPVNFSDLISPNNINIEPDSNKIKFNKTKNFEKNLKKENNSNLNKNKTENNFNPNVVEYKKLNGTNFSSPKIIQKEIDDLDKEIVELQTRLKYLLNE